LGVLKSFRDIANKYGSYNIKIDENSERDVIKVAYTHGPGIEMVKSEFEQNLPIQVDIKFARKDSKDMLEMIMN
jgi:hypothetical protein